MRWSEEDLEQKAFVEWLTVKKKQGVILTFFSIQNENTMSWAVEDKRAIFARASKDKKMGKRKGVSDICIVLQNIVLFVEMKKRGKRLKTKTSYAGITVTDEQKDFLHTIGKGSVTAGTVAYGTRQAIAFTRQFIESTSNPEKQPKS